MANYQDYRQVPSDQIASSSVTNAKLSIDARHCFCTQWVYGSPDQCATGCCCQWTAPTGVRRVFWEAWGAGGNGHGSCSCDRCQHMKGAGGGYYNTKMISTVAGCQYTVCAGGVYRCLSVECTACNGCTSYVNGYNLTNFCAIGGYTGETNGDWVNPCFSYWNCCLGPVSNGGDFGMGNHTGSWSGPFNCHCHCHFTMPTAAPFMAGEEAQALHVCWIRCGCWTSPYAHGAQGAFSTYCGSGTCGQGATGGAGVVKITYQ
jgi:hypothetical protein